MPQGAARTNEDEGAITARFPGEFRRNFNEILIPLPGFDQRGPQIVMQGDFMPQDDAAAFGKRKNRQVERMRPIGGIDLQGILAGNPGAQGDLDHTDEVGDTVLSRRTRQHAVRRRRRRQRPIPVKYQDGPRKALKSTRRQSHRSQVFLFNLQRSHSHLQYGSPERRRPDSYPQ